MYWGEKGHAEADGEKNGMTQTPSADWNPAQYEQFRDERRMLVRMRSDLPFGDLGLELRGVR